MNRVCDVAPLQLLLNRNAVMLDLELKKKKE